MSGPLRQRQRLVPGREAEPACPLTKGAAAAGCAACHVIGAARRLWAAASRPPPWADFERVRLGQRAFLRSAFASLFVLLHGSLTGGFAAPWITQVLRATGKAPVPHVSTGQRSQPSHLAGHSRTYGRAPPPPLLLDFKKKERKKGPVQCRGMFYRLLDLGCSSCCALLVPPVSRPGPRSPPIIGRLPDRRPDLDRPPPV